MTRSATDMISDNFSWYEVIHSDTAERSGIDNSLPESLESAASNTAHKLEKVRAALGNLPIKINSWYRGPALQALPAFYNPTSQHPKAEAVDFVCPQFGAPVDIAKKIISLQTLIPFDQLILEHTWVHISFCSNPSVKPRGQVLSLLAEGTKKYAVGLTDSKGNPL